MPKRILIDATHVEETRVVVLENGRVSEFESETSIKKQLKGNIYLAKITRVEPSLQAAFVEYGEDRHGFLPFSEIHPDYYNIPVADKQELLRSLRNEGGSDDDEDDAPKKNSDDDAEVALVSEGEEENAIKKPSDLYRKYKIQEVMKRNQIILVQVEKEERGNKGASLTTFLSLAGRYCVLMPNSLRKGGVSRRIDSYEDRKRLKLIISDLKIPDEAGIIIRTAGSKKDAADIKGDYDYLANLWNDIRQATLKSTAPAFIHAEGDIIKKTVRDMYNETVDELLIEGKDAYETAKTFMKTVMPSNLPKIKAYRNKVPIFSRYKVEEQIAALYDFEVSLESGGSIVINPTEALISIDVNSGRSTSQRNIEETALSTNLEAAYEIARQLRLRDLSGLIVADFIDMMDVRNRKAVERALKEAFANDRAKIQIGRISIFGLLEMSRQRLRASFLEVNSMVCSHCKGAGVVKATESTAVTVLRAIENEVSRGSVCEAAEVFVTSSVAIYILNNKRPALAEIEERYQVKVIINIDETLGTDGFSIDKIRNYAQEEVKPSYIKSGKNPDKREKKPHNRNSEKDVENHNDKDNVTPIADKDNRQKPRKRRDNINQNVDKNPQSDSFLEGLWKKIVD